MSAPTPGFEGGGIYAALSLEEAACLLQEPKDTLIFCHVRPDADAVGSAFALRALLSALGSRVVCVCGDEIPQRLRFLMGGAQRTLAYREALAQAPADFSPTRVVSVDTASPAQAGEVWTELGGVVHLMLDHHAYGQPYAPGWICPQAAATGELVFALSRAWLREGRLASIPEGVDAALYAAISADTGGFRYSNTTPTTHRVAAELLESGVDAAWINHALFECKERLMLLAEAEAARRMRFYAGGRIGVVSIPYALKQALGVEDEHLATLVDVPRSVAGVEVAAAIRQPTEASVYRVSMRSEGRVNVAALCAVWGGGGHAKAAGCTLEGGDPEQVARRVATALEQAMQAAETPPSDRKKE